MPNVRVATPRWKGNKPPRLVDEVDEVAIDRELFSKSFVDFVPDAFEVVEGGDNWLEEVKAGRQAPRFVDGWHVGAIAEHLQAVAEAQIKYLLINIPPGTMKSILCCVLWPAWLWQLNPALRCIFSSYTEEFTKRDTRRTKALINTDWYQRLFPHVKLKAEPDTQMEFHTTAGGERHGSSTNSGVTGKHVHGAVEDDPLKLQDAMSETKREEAWHYRTQALSTRLLPNVSWRVVVMQRLHEDDPSGRIIAANKAGNLADKYEHLCLPMEYEAKHPFRTRQTSIGFSDPRTKEGELLWPARMDAKHVAGLKSPQQLGTLGYAGQGQQRPSPAEGAIIQRAWFRHYKVLPCAVEAFDAVELSFDLIFDDDGPGSFAVGQAWGRLGANHYLLDCLRGRIDFIGQLRMFMRLVRRFPMAARKVVEKKAAGAPLLTIVRSKIQGCVAVTPTKSKPARTMAVSTLFEAGNVWTPDPEALPRGLYGKEPEPMWVSDFEEEVVGMTQNGATTATDDMLDACTQYLADKTVQVIPEGMVFNMDVGMQVSPHEIT